MTAHSSRPQSPTPPPSRVPGTLTQSTGKDDNARSVDYYLSVLDEVGQERSLRAAAALPAYGQPPIDIEQEAARERKIRNDNAEQDIRLKRRTLNWLFAFLLGETTAVFLYALFQGMAWPHKFHLEDWSFKLLVTATIAQITGMLFVAVRYLFPSGTAAEK